MFVREKPNPLISFLAYMMKASNKILAIRQFILKASLFDENGYKIKEDLYIGRV